MGKLTASAAKHPRQGLAEQRGRRPAAGAPPDADAAARLGREGHAGLPHPAAVSWASGDEKHKGQSVRIPTQLVATE